MWHQLITSDRAQGLWLALLIAAALLLGTACGGGAGRLTISFYGDSITSGGQVAHIVQDDFIGLDYAIGGQHSDAPLQPGDTARVVVIRYGMADAAHGLTPEQTRANVQHLVAQVRALGKRPIVVNVSQTPSGLERATNAALSDLVDIDVSDIQGTTLDGIHPDPAFYDRLNARIHAGLIHLLRDY